jgi:cell division protein FtsB
MIRRYIAVSLIIFFFSYAAYLIITDGGKNTTISFEKLNNNIQSKFLILTGQKEAKPTPFEIAKKKELDELKAAREAADIKAKEDAVKAKLEADAKLKPGNSP